MVTREQVAALIGKDVVLQDDQVRKYAKCVGLRAMWNDEGTLLIFVDLSDGYASNLDNMISLEEGLPPEI